MWVFLAWTIGFVAVASMLVGILVGATLQCLAPNQASPYRSSKRGIVGLTLGGALISSITALASVVFRLLLRIPMAPFWSPAVQIAAVTAVGVSGVHLGTWVAVQLARKQ
jgi:uncharacterized membrane protein